MNFLVNFVTLNINPSHNINEELTNLKVIITLPKG